MSPLALALAAPGAAAMTLMVLVLLLGAAGWHPLWPAEAGTPAELAAVGDRAGLLAARAGGRDLDRPYGVRAGILRPYAVVATPLEAAVAADQPEGVAWLVGEGTRLDEARRRTLVCFARQEGADAVAALLAAPGVGYDCTGVRAPWDDSLREMRESGR